VVPRGGLDALEERQIFALVQIELLFSGSPARSLTIKRRLKYCSRIKPNDVHKLPYNNILPALIPWGVFGALIPQFVSLSVGEKKTKKEELKRQRRKLLLVAYQIKKKYFETYILPGFL
jgi:hypothetical protein